MKREQLTDLIYKIDTINQSLQEIRQVVERELNAKSTVKKTVTKSSTKARHEDDNELIRAYTELRGRFAEVGPRAVEEFAAQKTASYLDRFITVNNIPIPTKRAKSETLESLSNYLARSRLIRGN